MTKEIVDFAVVGGGIVGLATALALQRRFPDASLALIEKEELVARHQSGRNSGVIHSGIYYAPGSLKARLARDGNRSMVEFCRENRVPHVVSGKLIVATRPEEVPRLDQLHERGELNDVHSDRLDGADAREIEPHVSCVAALRVPSAAVVDYTTVCEVMAKKLRSGGCRIRLGTPVTGIGEGERSVEIRLGDDRLAVGFAVFCGGLQSDRIARLGGLEPEIRIVPFRGEYFDLIETRRDLVRTMVYPVPDPTLPFLGVHFTRGIDGGVHIGPNAVLSFAREGYETGRFDAQDTLATVSFPGFWRMAARNARTGVSEMMRSMSRRRFVRSMQKMIPEVRADDVVPSRSGIRAQALTKDGRLVDDFLFIRERRSLHVCNAPSPAATASLEIGKMISDEVE